MMTLLALTTSLLPLGTGPPLVSIENPYFRLTCDSGGVATAAVDALGRSQWHDSLWNGPRLEADPLAVPTVTVEHTDIGGSVSIVGTSVTETRTSSTPSPSDAVPVPAGQSIVQPFLPGGQRLLSVTVSIPTWHTTDSEATLRLRRGAADGPVVAEERIAPAVDNAQHTLDLAGSTLPGDHWYYLELADVKGLAGFWFSGGNPVEAGAGLVVGGQVRSTIRASLSWVTESSATADITVSIDGPSLTFDWSVRGGYSGTTLLNWPWEQAGYDTQNPDTTPIHYLVTQGGIYMPVHQFKRRPFSGVSHGGSLYMSGTRGFDARFTFPKGDDAGWHLSFEPHRWVNHIPARSLKITVEPESRWLPDYFPRFTASDERAAALLTEFLYSHGMNFGAGVNPDWAEWESIIFAWQQNPQADQLRAWLTDGYKISDEGYAYCWGSMPGWPFPFKDDDADGQNDYDTRHFTTDPCFILGAWRHACWTRDDGFLRAVLPRCRKLMDFMLNDLHGSEGLIVAIGPQHTGKDGGVGNNYWDIQPFGHLDAFANSFFHGSLGAMAEIEDWVGDPERAQELRRVQALCRKRYTEVFWNDQAGRFVGCVDVDGVAHDYGFTYVDLDAMAYGLATREQAARIYDWIEHGITSSGTADTYSRWIFAPRANTFHNPGRGERGAERPPWWSWVWAGTAWEDQCQDGGAILYTSWSDVMARRWLRGGDDAWRRLSEIVDRYAMPDHLSGGSPLCRGERTQGGPGGVPGQVGVEGEFPESGVVPSSFLFAIIGLDARLDGLHIRPGLPSTLEWAGLENARYAGARLDVGESRTEIVVKWTPPGETRPREWTAAYLAGDEVVFRPWEGEALASSLRP